MDDLLIKYVLGEATREEAAQVERWLEADAANRRRYEEYRTLWMITRQTAARESAESVNSGEAWRQLRSTFGQKKGMVRLGGQRWLRVAAMVAGALILGAGGYLILMNHRPDAKITPVA